MAGTLGVLLVIVPLSALIGPVATGNATDAGGLAVLAMCVGGGVYALFDVLRQSGGGGALDAFARANDLVLIRGSLVPHYDGSLFADESHAVDQSVRTKDELFVEVGDRFSTTAPAGSVQPNRPQLFLRARLAGPTTRDPRELVTPALHEALSRFAGAYTLEVSGDELTVFGTDGLEVERRGRVQEAFALIDELAARLNDAIVPTQQHGAVEAAPASALSGFTVPVATRPAPRQGSPRRPGTIVVWTLALVIGVAVVIAIIMSILDDHLREGRCGTTRGLADRRSDDRSGRPDREGGHDGSPCGAGRTSRVVTAGPNPRGSSPTPARRRVVWASPGLPGPLPRGRHASPARPDPSSAALRRGHRHLRGRSPPLDPLECLSTPVVQFQ